MSREAHFITVLHSFLSSSSPPFSHLLLFVALLAPPSIPYDRRNTLTFISCLLLPTSSTTCPGDTVALYTYPVSSLRTPNQFSVSSDLLSFLLDTSLPRSLPASPTVVVSIGLTSRRLLRKYRQETVVQLCYWCGQTEASAVEKIGE